MSEPAIQAEGLIREFKKGPRAVDAIDLAVQPGEIYGFLGPNGAGKSTTVHMLTTLLPPTSGRARVAGFDVAREGPQVRMHIGAALQEAALDPLLTGREHLVAESDAGGCERQRLHAAVVRGAAALHEAARLEPVDEPGHVRRVAEEPVGQNAHRDRLVRVEHAQRVCLREAEAELGQRRAGLHALGHSDLEEELLRLVGGRRRHAGAQYT